MGLTIPYWGSLANGNPVVPLILFNCPILSKAMLLWSGWLLFLKRKKKQIKSEDLVNQVSSLRHSTTLRQERSPSSRWVKFWASEPQAHTAACYSAAGDSTKDVLKTWYLSISFLRPQCPGIAFFSKCNMLSVSCTSAKTRTACNFWACVASRTHSSPSYSPHLTIYLRNDSQTITWLPFGKKKGLVYDEVLSRFFNSEN